MADCLFIVFLVRKKIAFKIVFALFDINQSFILHNFLYLAIPLDQAKTHIEILGKFGLGWPCMVTSKQNDDLKSFPSSVAISMQKI